MTAILSLSVAMFAGILLSRLARKVKLPAVTAYLVAGILIGPYFLGALGIEGLGFVSMANVKSFKIISEVALGFIAFLIGNEFRLSQLKTTGKQATIIGIFQAVFTSLIVDAALIGLHFIIPDKLSLPAAIVLGSVAAATAPAATLMVVKQYKAKGPLTSILLPIVALDDAVGLMLFAISFGIAKALISGTISLISVLVDPLIEVVASLVLGTVIGLVYNLFEKHFHSRSKRLTLSVCFVFLAVALSMLKFDIGKVTISFSSLLVCMMLGTIFCNLCEFSEDIMDQVDRWTAPLFVLFFVLSGSELELSVFSDALIVAIGIVYIVTRCVGKYFGARISAKYVKCTPNIIKYLGITLFPQAGVALGMALKAQSLGAEGEIVTNITLFSVLIYELIGPFLTKVSLLKAGEIDPNGKTNRRQHKAK